MIDVLKVKLSGWNAWRVKSVNHRIFAATITVGIFTFLVKIASVIKELAIAHQFGTHDDLDAFLIALLLPSFAISVVAWSLNSAFIPTYIQVEEKSGIESAKQLFSNVITLNIIGLISLSIIFALSASFILPILAKGFDPRKLALTRSLFLILLPTVVFSGLTTVWGATLNAKDHFILAAINPIITPAIIVLMIFGFGKSWGIFVLAYGTTAGLIIELFFLGRQIKRNNFSIIPHWYGLNPETKKVIRQYIPMVVGAFLMSNTGLIDQAMAAMLNPGSVSTLSYGNKMVAFLIGVGSFALSTAVLPHFSRMAAQEDWTSILRTLKFYIFLTLIVTIPVSCLLMYYSEPLVRLLFERGAFTPADTTIVSRVQVMYLFQIPFYFFGILGVRLLSALKKNHFLTIIGGINLIVNIIGNYVLMKYLGVAGIALSTSIVYIISSFLITVVIYKHFLEINRKVSK